MITKKENTISFFGEGCKKCSRKFDCISATSVTSDLRKYLLKVNGYQQKPTIYMSQGKAMHKKEQIGIKTLDEYGIDKFKEDFYRGKQITLSEVKVCSPKYGFRGIIDILEIKFDKDNNITIKIRELKKKWWDSYITQIAIYGLIFSDRDMCFYYEKKGRKKVKLMPFKVYPKIDFNLNIYCTLEMLEVKKTYAFTFMENNLISDQMSGISVDAINKANLRRVFHKRGIYYIENTPPCKFCMGNSDYCSLWEICSKVNYEEERKQKQMYLGKRKTLTKTKPILYKEVRLK